jgi:hypothetical protein
MEPNRYKELSVRHDTILAWRDDYDTCSSTGPEYSRWFMLFILACCVSLSACLRSETVANNPDSATNLLVYERTGGIANLDDHLRIDRDGTTLFVRHGQTSTFVLDEASIQRLTNDLDAIPFSNLDASYLPSNSGADQITYELRYQGKTVRMVDTTIPDQLVPVLEQLDGIILNQSSP